jgi:hypothetical protein
MAPRGIALCKTLFANRRQRRSMDHAVALRPVPCGPPAVLPSPRCGPRATRRSNAGTASARVTDAFDPAPHARQTSQARVISCAMRDRRATGVNSSSAHVTSSTTGTTQPFQPARHAALRLVADSHRNKAWPATRLQGFFTCRSGLGPRPCFEGQRRLQQRRGMRAGVELDSTHCFIRANA